jgi:hypothetical protein
MVALWEKLEGKGAGVEAFQANLAALNIYTEMGRYESEMGWLS